MPTSEFSASINLLPPSTNPVLVASGPLALYNPTLILIATALSQHSIIFGIFFLLRGFSAKRVFDIHYLTFLQVLSLSLTGLIFLIDPAFDNFKVFFFLDHEAIEAVLALRILLPVKTCREYAGFILFCLWGALCTTSVAVSLSGFYSHGADIIAWGAFCSDFMLGISGVVLIKRWFELRPRLGHVSPTLRMKAVAEGLAGFGFVLHGMFFSDVSRPEFRADGGQDSRQCVSDLFSLEFCTSTRIRIGSLMASLGHSLLQSLLSHLWYLLPPCSLGPLTGAVGTIERCYLGSRSGRMKKMDPGRRLWSERRVLIMRVCVHVPIRSRAGLESGRSAKTGWITSPVSWKGAFRLAISPST
ncbi:hypothetical protein BKA64DRAFT_212822 [Cadophora sp. MPI-SDFR-AT-0126]|nr:hypothetical protein BKA64DRAFT_212822 [Leotiomycetes sp. MPI-SDFR-AT-0126]